MARQEIEEAFDRAYSHTGDKTSAAILVLVDAVLGVDGTLSSTHAELQDANLALRLMANSFAPQGEKIKIHG